MLQLIIMYINCDHAPTIRLRKDKSSMDTVVNVVPEVYCTVCKVKYPSSWKITLGTIEKWFRQQDKNISEGVSAC